MYQESQEIIALRAEMMTLLRQQLDALDTPEGLTDSRLMECYARQSRVQELREKLQSVTNADRDCSMPSDSATDNRSNLIMMPTSSDESAISIAG